MGGPTPLSWTEINAYNVASCSNLTAWEKEQIRSMSEQCCAWLQKGKSITQSSPFNPFFESIESRDKMRDNVNDQWKAMKAARKAAKQQKPPEAKIKKTGNGAYKLKGA